MSDSTAIWQVESPRLPRPAVICLDHGLLLLLQNRDVKKTGFVGDKNIECDLCRGFRENALKSLGNGRTKL